MNEDETKTEGEQETATEEQQDNAQQEEEQADKTDWKAIALKNKAIADRYKKKLENPPLQEKPKQEHDDEVVKTVKRLEMIEEKRTFGFDNELSPEETDFVFKISGGKPTKEILNDTFVKAGLEGYRSNKRLEANTPSSSHRSSVFTDKPFTDLSEDERKNTFESKMKGIGK